MPMTGNDLMRWRLQKPHSYKQRKFSNRKRYAKEATVFLEASRKSKDSEVKILKSAFTYVHMIEYHNPAVLNNSPRKNDSLIL